MTDFFDALLFPGEIHVRNPDPGPYSDYRSYKPHLKREFRRKCVYCRESDGLKGDESFGVDHYHPKSRTPDPALVKAWSNLFYACNVCNSRKGTSESTVERFLPNPCAYPPSVQPMAEHLQYRNGDVETYTHHGAWMSELLQLETPKRRQSREFVRSALGLFLAARTNLLTLVATLAEASDADSAQALRAALEKLQRTNRGIERLTGESVDLVGSAA